MQYQVCTIKTAVEVRKHPGTVKALELQLILRHLPKICDVIIQFSTLPVSNVVIMAFGNVFNSRVTGFHRGAKHFEWNFFMRKTYLLMVIN